VCVCVCVSVFVFVCVCGVCVCVCVCVRGVGVCGCAGGVTTACAKFFLSALILITLLSSCLRMVYCVCFRRRNYFKA